MSGSRDILQDQLNVGAENIILNTVHPNPKHIVNCICLIVKQYIYRKRCGNEKPRFREVRAEIYKLENIEKYIATKNGKLERHQQKWYFSSSKENLTQNFDDYIQEYITASEMPNL